MAFYLSFSREVVKRPFLISSIFSCNMLPARYAVSWPDRIQVTTKSMKCGYWLCHRTFPNTCILLGIRFLSDMTFHEWEKWFRHFEAKYYPLFQFLKCPTRHFNPWTWGNTLPLKVGTRIPPDAPPYQRRMETTLKPLRKPQILLVSCSLQEAGNALTETHGTQVFKWLIFVANNVTRFTWCTQACTTAFFQNTACRFPATLKHMTSALSFSSDINPGVSNGERWCIVAEELPVWKS